MPCRDKWCGGIEHVVFEVAVVSSMFGFFAGVFQTASYPETRYAIPPLLCVCFVISAVIPRALCNGDVFLVHVVQVNNPEPVRTPNESHCSIVEILLVVRDAILSYKAAVPIAKPPYCKGPHSQCLFVFAYFFPPFFLFSYGVHTHASRFGNICAYVCRHDENALRDG